MKLNLTDDDQLLAESLERLFVKCATGARIREAEKIGIDEDLWQQLCELDMPVIRVWINEGGAGGTLLHAIIVAEAAGRFLAPVPLIESIVGLGLLSRLGGAAADLAQSIVSEGGVVTLSLADAGQHPRQIVPAGALASAHRKADDP